LGTLGGSNKLMTLHEVADVLGYADQTVCNCWRLPFYGPGGAGKLRLRIKELDFWNWLETREAA